ncbi:MAG: alanine dehydrogenase [Acidobacteriota bacterium]
MNIGILRESERREKRIPLTPSSIQSLIEDGHTVFFQAGAGEGAGYHDEEFSKVGAHKVYSEDEAIVRSDIILKISSLSENQVKRLRENQVIFAFHHMAVAKRSLVEELLNKKVIAIGYEIIQDDRGTLPCLVLMSEIAGAMVPIIAGHYLQSDRGGKGLLLGGITSVPPATVMIIGCGVVGKSAARACLDLGAHVIVLDKDLNKLKQLEESTSKTVITALANPYNISKYIQYADVLIGSILIPGERAPKVVTKEMIKSMKPGAVIIDISIDQGGCIESSRPTTIEDPIYTYDEKIHYCVPNIPSVVSRTASIGLSNVLCPYVEAIADMNIDEALRKEKCLARGVYLYKGKCVREGICELFDLEYTELF